VQINAHISLELSSAQILHVARAVVTADIHDVAANNILGSLNEQQKEGHATRVEAERRAVRKLATKIVQQLGSKIEMQLLR
jgi:hypothetical protein